MEMIATDGGRHVYSDSGILLQTTASVSILCLLLSCCRPPFVSWLCTMTVKGGWQVRCTTEFGHSPQCPNVNACTSKRSRDKIHAQKLMKMQALQAAAAVLCLLQALSFVRGVWLRHTIPLRRLFLRPRTESVEPELGELRDPGSDFRSDSGPSSSSLDTVSYQQWQ